MQSLKKLVKRILKKTIYPSLKKYIINDSLKRSANFKGTYTLEEDKIVFKVDKQYIQKISKNQVFTTLSILGICLEEDIKKECGLDKAIIYLFENITFDNILEIKNFFGGTVHFKNCNFKKQIVLGVMENVIFESNTYMDNLAFYKNNSCFFNAPSSIQHLQFINENFINSEQMPSYYSKDILPKFGMHLKNIEKLTIINSNMETSGLGNFEITTKQFVCKNSKITSSEIYLDVNHLEEENTIFIAEKGIIIETKENNPIRHIYAPIIIYNGLEFHFTEPINLEEEKIALQRERKKLIEFLQKIRNETQFYVGEETKKITNQSLEVVVPKIKQRKSRGVNLN